MALFEGVASILRIILPRKYRVDIVTLAIHVGVRQYHGEELLIGRRAKSANIAPTKYGALSTKP